MPSLRLLTYNVHRCLGIDGVLSPVRIAEVIASCEPDVVALQELDVRRPRTGGVDQAEEIGRALGMSEVFFHPAVKVLEEEFGDAIITARSARLVKADAIPGPIGPQPVRREPRGAIWAEIDAEGQPLQVINTHFGLGRAERRVQADTLMGSSWIGDKRCRRPVALLGDFNSFPNGRVHARLSARLRDAQREASPGTRPRPTFPSRLPVFRIDYAFLSDDIDVRAAKPLETVLSRVASDHLPLVVDIEFDHERGQRQVATRPSR